jgi:DNA (cytosine-5)-methyltransferase 1
VKPLLLDLFCCAGGAARGYQQAGFHVVGVDIKPQPRYAGDEFIQGDALEYVAEHGHEFDAIHASPPCQGYSEMTPIKYRADHPDMIEPTRNLLQAIGKPYVIENVEGAKLALNNPVMLCGSMFGLPLQRHRYFEIWPEVFALLPPCNHSIPPILITGTTTRFGGKYEFPVDVCKVAAGIDWMTRKELDQAIPPAYTEWIGQHLMDAISEKQLAR